MRARGDGTSGLDLVGSGTERGDVRNAEDVRAAVDSCEGIIHLAAVSRVIWGERDPERCWETNVGGLQNVVQAAQRSLWRPWFIFASSREVYGQPNILPTDEDAPLRPVNHYGRTKVEGEEIVRRAQDHGLVGGILRLSNVYGSTRDHVDRVIPAFARAAAVGDDLLVEGMENTFDFTHLDDTVQGILALVDLLRGGATRPSPMHLLTGQPTTLGQLSELAVRIGGNNSKIVSAPPRSYDVGRFWGDPSRAHDVLGWRPQISLAEGLDRLIGDFREENTVHRRSAFAACGL